MGVPGINISKQFHSLKILASQITCELERQTNNLGHCAIYEEELQRIWPLDEENRERKIAQFARDYGFHLSLYRHGLCAIFVKETPNVSV
jgi:hypothetical protein